MDVLGWSTPPCESELKLNSRPRVWGGYDKWPGWRGARGVGCMGAESGSGFSGDALLEFYLGNFIQVDEPFVFC